MANFETERRLQREQIRNRLREIYRTVYSNRQAIPKLYSCVTGRGRGPEGIPESGWQPFELSGRWGGFDETTWFKMEATIPASMKGERAVALIRASDYSMIPEATGLTEGGESLAYLNGKPVQGLDRNRDELVLFEKARGGEKVEIVLEACPSTRYDLYHLFSYADLAVKHSLPWDFYWDATVALEVCENLDEEFAPRRKLLELIYRSVLEVDLQHVGEKVYFESLLTAQKRLRKGLKEFHTSYGVGKLILAGHAHIDTAWLWPLRETKRKCARTFSTVLRLMEEYPEFHFACSQPQQYAWIEEHYPDLFEAIKHRVKEGRWELCGGAWIEPDHNVPSGESLIRQYLYGNRWFEKQFGKRSKIAWIPDSFGYTWSLPQILRKAQIEAFVTTKIDWSQYTNFPYSFFLWEGIDGTQIPAVMPPLNYNGNPVPGDLVAQWNQFKQKELVEELPFAFGWGDGGGGPTMEMIEHGKRLGNMVGVPQCEFGRLSDSVLRMTECVHDGDLPVYNDELYLELHRGCQTSQSRTKRLNRQCETLLRDCEFLSALAMHIGAEYDQETLEQAWKIVLTNQFHDLLPGSSIEEVYVQSEKDYALAKELIEGTLDEAVRFLLEHIDMAGEGTPLVVFNTLGFVRNDVASVEVDVPEEAYTVLNPAGESVPAQRGHDGRLLFEASGVPPMGYAVYWLRPGRDTVPTGGSLSVSPSAIENDFVRVDFDKDGLITSIYDKLEEREVLETGGLGNRLQLFDDRPHDYDAWDIDVNFEDKSWEPRGAESIEVLEEGPVRGVVRIVRKTERSTIQQDVTLYANSPRIDFVTHVDWHERRTLMKAAFPIDLRSSKATYEIQFGAIERSTHDNTAHDRARFEVPAQRWADLSEGNYGVSLLNDCKYGYDVKRNVLRLSLLRSPVDPDPEADQGAHEFTYSLYAHAGDWRNGTVHHAAELNCPLRVVPGATSEGPLPSTGTFLSCDAEHVFVDTIKKAEDSDTLVVRLYEAYGHRGEIELTFSDQPESAVECDLMEENDVAANLSGNSIRFYVKPFEIRTFRVAF